jgi:RNA polymerase sigma-70 factor (ECF subfamily)
MDGPTAPQPAEPDHLLSDEEVVERVRAGDLALYEILMRRHNQRLYRAVRAILRDEAEVEDILQEAYLVAFGKLGGFEGRARFSTWLTRIAVNRALDRRRRRAPMARFDPQEEGRPMHHPRAPGWGPQSEDPERESARRELAQLLETAIDGLPEPFRGVYMLREVEGMDTQETAESLGIEAATVKTRLHRARGLLRERLMRDFDGTATDAFPFGADRCDRLVNAVLERVKPPRR